MSRADSPLAGRMLFLVGARRSGTNWLQHLLTLHPQLVGVPSETHVFYGVDALRERVQHGLISSSKTGWVYMEREDFLDATRDWCDAAFAPALTGTPGARVLVERTPLHAHHLDLIAAIYPDARVIHLVRDGTAVARSLLAQEWGPTTLRDAAREWADVVRAVHAAEVPDLRELRNEDIAADPVTALTDLWEWVGLDVDDDLRDAVRREAATPVNVTAGRPGTTRPAPLTVAEAAAVVEEAGAELSRLRYPLPEGSPTAAVPERSAPLQAVSRLQPPLRRAARTAVRRIRAARGEKEPAVAPGGTTWAEQAQAAVDLLMAAIETRDRAALARVLTADAEVTIGAEPAVGGDAAVDRLLAAAAPEPGVRQVFSAVHGANPTFTIAVSRQRGDEEPSWLVLVVTPRGDQAAQVSCYRAERSSAR